MKLRQKENKERPVYPAGRSYANFTRFINAARDARWDGSAG